MADFDSQLPIRSEAANNVTKLANSSNVTIDPALEGGNLATIAGGDAAGRANVNIQLNAAVNVAQVGGAAIALGQAAMAASVPVVIANNQSNVPTNLAQVGGAAIALGSALGAASVPVVIASDQGNVPINTVQLGGNAIDLGAGNAGAGTQRVVIATDQVAIPVTMGAIENISDYKGTGDIASGSNDVHNRTPAGTEYFLGFDASASGQIRVELKIGTTGVETKRGVWFGGGKQGSGIVSIRLPHRITVPNTDSVKLDIKNTDNQALPLYSTIWMNA